MSFDLIIKSSRWVESRVFTGLGKRVAENHSANKCYVPHRSPLIQDVSWGEQK